jgi:hypothetical protein
MVSVFTSGVIDLVFDPRSGQIKDYKIGNTASLLSTLELRRKSNGWLTLSHDNVSDWSNKSVCGLLFKLINTIKHILACWSSTKLTSLSSYQTVSNLYLP